MSGITSSKYFCSCGKTTLLDGSQSCLCNEIERLLARLSSVPELMKRCLDAETRAEELESRWHYIKTDTEGARSLLLLLSAGKGSPDDFDTMVDRIIESRNAGEKDRRRG